jgi:hypothetical protein
MQPAENPSDGNLSDVRAISEMRRQSRTEAKMAHNPKRHFDYHFFGLRQMKVEADGVTRDS